MTYSFADYIRLTAITYQSFGLDKKLRTSFEVLYFLEATTRFELVIRVLQTHALPLGYVAILKKWSG